MRKGFGSGRPEDNAEIYLALTLPKVIPGEEVNGAVLTCYPTNVSTTFEGVPRILIGPEEYLRTCGHCRVIWRSTE
jgi:D-mannonate dehydratase